MSALLVVNCVMADAPRREFDDVIVPRLVERWAGEHRVARLADGDALERRRGDTHLLLSGSELSAARANPRDAELEELIRAFVEADGAVLGICYGHQMVARALGGACRRAAAPEFGWRRVRRVPNALWAGMADSIAVHSHYDEVCALPKDFEVIAESDDCAVQAFQVAGTRVWGTQFHPEQPFTEGDAMLRANLASEALAPTHWADELEDPALVDGNLRLFDNWFGA